jgi:hypothetical protein
MGREEAKNGLSNFGDEKRDDNKASDFIFI